MTNLSKYDDSELISELNDRGFDVLKDPKKCPTDTWKDEYIKQLYHELSWIEWQQLARSIDARKKARK